MLDKGVIYLGTPSMKTTIKVAELYNNGIKSTKGIGAMLNIATGTVCSALKIAKEEGLCDYIPQPRGKSQMGSGLNYKKKVKCVTTGVAYDSITDAYYKTKCLKSKISDCCHNRIPEVESKDGKVYKFEFI